VLLPVLTCINVLWLCVFDCSVCFKSHTQAVALVVKYADNIYKGFGHSISIIFCNAISSVVFEDTFVNETFMLGSFMVVFATAVYYALTNSGGSSGQLIEKGANSSLHPLNSSTINSTSNSSSGASGGGRIDVSTITANATKNSYKVISRASRDQISGLLDSMSVPGTSGGGGGGGGSMGAAGNETSHGYGYASNAINSSYSLAPTAEPTSVPSFSYVLDDGNSSGGGAIGGAADDDVSDYVDCSSAGLDCDHEADVERPGGRNRGISAWPGAPATPARSKRAMSSAAVAAPDGRVNSSISNSYLSGGDGILDAFGRRSAVGGGANPDVAGGASYSSSSPPPPSKTPPPKSAWIGGWFGAKAGVDSVSDRDI
jgi:hypothetical protein